MIERIGPYRYYPDTECWLHDEIVHCSRIKGYIYLYRTRIRGIKETDFKQIDYQCGFPFKMNKLNDAQLDVSAIMYNDKGEIDAVIICGSKSLRDYYGPNIINEFGCEKHYWSRSRQVLGVYINPNYIIDLQELFQLCSRANSVRNKYIQVLWCNIVDINPNIAELFGFDKWDSCNKPCLCLAVDSGSYFWSFDDIDYNEEYKMLDGEIKILNCPKYDDTRSKKE